MVLKFGVLILDEHILDTPHSNETMFESIFVEKVNIKLCKYILWASMKPSNDEVKVNWVDIQSSSQHCITESLLLLAIMHYILITF